MDINDISQDEQSLNQKSQSNQMESQSDFQASSPQNSAQIISNEPANALEDTCQEIDTKIEEKRDEIVQYGEDNLAYAAKNQELLKKLTKLADMSTIEMQTNNLSSQAQNVLNIDQESFSKTCFFNCKNHHLNLEPLFRVIFSEIIRNFAKLNIEIKERLKSQMITELNEKYGDKRQAHIECVKSTLLPFEDLFAKNAPDTVTHAEIFVKEICLKLQETQGKFNFQNQYDSQSAIFKDTIQKTLIQQDKTDEPKNETQVQKQSQNRAEQFVVNINNESQNLVKIAEKAPLTQKPKSHGCSSIVNHEYLFGTPLLGKRARKPPQNLNENVQTNNQKEQKGKGNQNGQLQTKNRLNPVLTKKISENDPFQGPFSRSLFKSLFLADKLKVLYEATKTYDVKLFKKDLKGLSAERQQKLIDSCQGTDQSKYAMPDPDTQIEIELEQAESNGLEMAAATETNFQDLSQILSNQIGQKKKKTHKKKDLVSWFANISENVLKQQMEEQEKRDQLKEKALTYQVNKYYCTKTNSVPGENVPSLKKSDSIENTKNSIDIVPYNVQTRQIQDTSDINAPQTSSLQKANSTPILKDENSEILTSNPQILSIDDNLTSLPPIEDLKELENFKYKTRSANLTTLEILYQRYANGYYQSLDDLQIGFISLIDRSKQERCKNDLAHEYLNQLKEIGIQDIQRRQGEFLTKWRIYHKTLFQGNQVHPRVTGTWNKKGWPKRQYFNIDEYKIVGAGSSSNSIKSASKLQSSPERIAQEIEASLEQQQKENVQIKGVDIQDKPWVKDVQEKMKTEIVSQCDGNCCKVVDQTDQEETKKVETVQIRDPLKTQPDQKLEKIRCNCAQQKVECGDLCSCKSENCNNRQMSLGQGLKMGRDVEERVAWGIDLYTAMNLIQFSPKDVPCQKFSEFIEKRLMFAIQLQGKDGFDIRNALNHIISNASHQINEIESYNEDQLIEEDQLSLWIDKDDPSVFSLMEADFARLILTGISQLEEQNDPYFRVHSKGLGIFCNKKEGISKDNLVVEYFGEIYPSWLWYEKQDVLKQGQNSGKLSNDLPDFYNIQYERHFEDPAGYDVLTVDPILHGSYASRLSHSCNPNCQTIIKARQTNKQYSIGMFATQKIRYGDELSFNYCSFTESQAEFDNAQCLCGATNCSGKFLQLPVLKKKEHLMRTYHTFIDRNMILFLACKATQTQESTNLNYQPQVDSFETQSDPQINDGLTEEDRVRLDRNGLKSSVLKDIPSWLKKWASLVCEFIEFEQSIYPQTENCKGLNKTAIYYELKSLRESHLNNIAITIDKVSRVLKQIGSKEAPLKILKPAQILHSLWLASDSIKASLLKVLGKVEKNDQNDEIVKTCRTVIQDMNDTIENNPLEKVEDLLQIIRETFQMVSAEIRQLDSSKILVDPLADFLYMYSRIETYFTYTDYQRYESDTISIRKCDVAGAGKPTVNAKGELVLDQTEQEKSVYTGRKEYQPQYVWGQLTFWFKQSGLTPEASLSADRRGTLSMPTLESFVVTAKNQEGNFHSGSARPTRRRSTKRNIQRDLEDFEPEVMPTQGSRRRRGAFRSQNSDQNLKLVAQKSSSGPMTIEAEDQQTLLQSENKVDYSSNSSCNGEASSALGDIDSEYNLASEKKLKVTYPHKKHKTRKEFLENWESIFAKPFDTCCHWSFKNPHKMYGSIQLESLLKAGNDREKRLQYFKEIVEHLKSYH